MTRNRWHPEWLPAAPDSAQSGRWIRWTAEDLIHSVGKLQLPLDGTEAGLPAQRIEERVGFQKGQAGVMHPHGSYVAAEKPAPRYVILALERIVDMRGMVGERWLVNEPDE